MGTGILVGWWQELGNELDHDVHPMNGRALKGIMAIMVGAIAVGNTPGARSFAQVSHLKGFDVIEFRRYLIKEGKREQFARYFESFFPEAFEQLGAIAFGQFLEHNHPDRFTWIRGFHDTDARGTVNAAFYYGPLWKEHRSTMNSLLVDSDDVLLLRPWSPTQGIPVLPGVDPVNDEHGAQGVIVAQIFPVRADQVDAFVMRAEQTFAAYRAAGVREAGLLVTLDGPNTWPQHPVRTDGPYLVWLGVLAGEEALMGQFMPLADRALPSLYATGLLRGVPESIVMDPTHRSRLRWLPGQ